MKIENENSFHTRNQIRNSKQFPDLIFACRRVSEFPSEETRRYSLLVQSAQILTAIFVHSAQRPQSRNPKLLCFAQPQGTKFVHLYQQSKLLNKHPPALWFLVILHTRNRTISKLHKRKIDYLYILPIVNSFRVQYTCIIKREKDKSQE